MRTMHALLLGSFVATAILALQGTAVAQGEHFGGYGGGSTVQGNAPIIWLVSMATLAPAAKEEPS